MAAEAKSVSQGKILGNFQALDPIYKGINNFILLPEQAPGVPVVPALNIGLYSRHVGATTALFIKEGANPERDITTAVKAGKGSTVLPSGIILKWGRETIIGANKPIVYGAVIGNFPTNTLWAMATPNQAPANTGNSAKDWILLTQNYANTGFNVHRDYYQGADVDFVWLAIGY